MADSVSVSLSLSYTFMHLTFVMSSQSIELDLHRLPFLGFICEELTIVIMIFFCLV